MWSQRKCGWHESQSEELHECYTMLRAWRLQHDDLTDDHLDDLTGPAGAGGAGGAPTARGAVEKLSAGERAASTEAAVVAATLAGVDSCGSLLTALAGLTAPRCALCGSASCQHAQQQSTTLTSPRSAPGGGHGSSKAVRRMISATTGVEVRGGVLAWWRHIKECRLGRCEHSPELTVSLSLSQVHNAISHRSSVIVSIHCVVWGPV